jgi:hypothetical protein
VRGVVGVGEPVDGAGAHVGHRIGQSTRERHGATTIPPGTGVDTRRTVPPPFTMFRLNAAATDGACAANAETLPGMPSGDAELIEP